MYKKMGGENWVWNINLTSALFAGLLSFHIFHVFNLSAMQRKLVSFECMSMYYSSLYFLKWSTWVLGNCTFLVTTSWAEHSACMVHSAWSRGLA